MSILERFRVDGKVAIVTGGGRGIGKGLALALAEAGADVCVAARRQADLEEVTQGIAGFGRRGLAQPTDVNDPKQLAALVERTVAELGRVDILVNNAGGALPGQAVHLSDEMFESALHFNVTAPLHLSRLVAPHMVAAGGGSIVNVSSAMGHLVDSGFVAYGTSKAALDHMTRLLAYEWAPRIRVNALAVGATLTDALEMVVSDASVKEQMVARHPMGRLGTVEDVAAAGLYLASPASAWVTGKVFEVDGGAPASTWPYTMPSGLPE